MCDGPKEEVVDFVVIFDDYDDSLMAAKKNASGRSMVCYGGVYSQRIPNQRFRGLPHS